MRARTLGHDHMDTMKEVLFSPINPSFYGAWFIAIVASNLTDARPDQTFMAASILSFGSFGLFVYAMYMACSSYADVAMLLNYYGIEMMRSI